MSVPLSRRPPLSKGVHRQQSHGLQAPQDACAWQATDRNTFCLFGCFLPADTAVFFFCELFLAEWPHLITWKYNSRWAVRHQRYSWLIFCRKKLKKYK